MLLMKNYKMVKVAFRITPSGKHLELGQMRLFENLKNHRDIIKLSVGGDEL